MEQCSDRRSTAGLNECSAGALESSTDGDGEGQGQLNEAAGLMVGEQIGESGAGRLPTTGRVGPPTSSAIAGQQEAEKDGVSPNGGQRVETGPPKPQRSVGEFNYELREIYRDVVRVGTYNFQGARRRVPSGLNIEAWRRYLHDYEDANLVDMLEFGWPVNFSREHILVASGTNHPSAEGYPADIAFYINTEMRHEALAGPFSVPPVAGFHTSPLMTKPKKDTANRRVIMDLSWSVGGGVNDGIPTDWYIDGPATIKLPTSDYMEGRLLELGRGVFMYKTDLSRGYRQLRVDPLDWPLLGFSNGEYYCMDVCPPFGLRTAAMCMQRTSQAIAHIHDRRGFYSRPYLDDFGGGGSYRRTGSGCSLHITGDNEGTRGSRGTTQGVLSSHRNGLAGDHLQLYRHDNGDPGAQTSRDHGSFETVGGAY